MNKLFSWYRGDAAAVNGSSDSFQEAIYWTEKVFKPYSIYSAETQEQLASTYGIVVFNDPENASAFTEDGDLKEALLSTDILYDDDLWESLYLDDFQVELLKSRAYEQYWAKELEIAQAVVDYAQDNSSDKATADDTLAALQDAETVYNTALETYDALVAELQNIGDKLSARQDKAAEIQKGIKDLQEELTVSRQRHQDLVEQFFIQDPDYLKDKYQSFYKELLAAKGLDPDRSDESLGTAMEEYLAAAHKYNLENQVSLVSEQLELLLNGEENNIGSDKKMNHTLYSLSELKKLVSDIDSFELVFKNDAGSFAGSDFFKSLEDKLHLSMSDYYYTEFAALWSELIDQENREEARTSWKMLQLVKKISKRAEGWLENRMAEVRLLSSSDFGSWFDRYYSDAGLAADAADSARLEYALEAAGYSETGFIGERMEAEYALLSGMIDAYKDSGSPETFSFYDWTGSDNPVNTSQMTDDMFKQILWEELKRRYGSRLGTELDGQLKSLNELKKWWSDLSGTLKDNENTITEKLSGEEFEFLPAYLSGGGIFLTADGDLGAQLISDRSDEIQSNSALAAILSKNMYNAVSLKTAVTEIAWNELSAYLIDTGLTDENNRFRQPEDLVGLQNFADAEEVYKWMRDLESRASEFYGKIPDYAAAQLQNYLGEVRDFTAVNLVYAFSDSLPESTELIQEKLKTLTEKNGGLKIALNNVQSTNRSEVNKLLSLVEIVGTEDELYSFIEKQLAETAALDIARSSVVNSETLEKSWEEYFDIQNVSRNLDGSYAIDPWKESIIEKAEKYIRIAEALEKPDEVDWEAAGPELTRYAKTAYWNTMGLDSALSLAEKNPLNVLAHYELAQMYDSFGTYHGMNDGTAFTSAIMEDFISDVTGGANQPVSNAALNLAVQWRDRIGSITTWGEFYDELTADIRGAVAGVDSSLMELAKGNAPGSELYRKALSYGLYNSMKNVEGSDDEYVLKALNWFTSLTGTAAACFDSKNADDMMGLLSNGVIPLLDDDELIHYYKTGILSKTVTPADWADRNPDVVSELDDFYSRTEFSRTYNAVLHGEITEYVKSKYPGNLAGQLEIINQHTSSTAHSVRWDDMLFTVDSIGKSAADVLASAASLKTYGPGDMKYDDAGAVSRNTNTSGGNRSIYIYAVNLLREEMAGNNEALAALSSRKALTGRAVQIKKDCTGDISNRHWRTLLTDEYLYSANNKEGEGPGQGIIVAKETDDRTGRDLTVNREGDSDAPFAAVSESAVLNRAENDLDNWYLDERNDVLDSASSLTESLELWLSGDKSGSSLTGHLDWLGGNYDEAFWTALSAMDREAVRKEAEYQNTMADEFHEKSDRLQNLQGRITHYKSEMTRFSNIAYILETAGTDPAEQLEVLEPVKAEIEKLEQSIAEAQENWQMEIDRSGQTAEAMGYRQLSELYDAAYGETKDSIDALEEAKHSYALARAVYNYASAGYLTAASGDLLSLEIENSRSLTDGSETDAETADTSDSADGETAEPEIGMGSNSEATAAAMNVGGEVRLAEEDAEVRQDLLGMINKVTPVERLAYVTEKHTRAQAAYDALYQIVHENRTENYNIYKNDGAYAAYFDSYLTVYRESLTLDKMNNVLNAAVARQEGITRRAHSEWQAARGESFVSAVSYDEEKEMSLMNSENLKGMSLVKDGDGGWEVSWDPESEETISDEVNNDYFAVKETDPHGLSEYEHDMNNWLRRLENLKKSKGESAHNAMIERWTLAMQREVYKKLTEAEKDEYFEYLNLNEADVITDSMKNDARKKVEERWENAFLALGSADENERELFDFFKLVEKSGGVTIGDKSENFESIQVDLDRELAFKEINRQVGAQVAGHTIAAAVFFAKATVCFGAAAALFAIPFWLGVPAGLVMAASGLLFSGFAVEHVYKGNIKQDCVDHNNDRFVNPGKRHRTDFENTLSSELTAVETLRQEYEQEQKLLETLKGEAEEGKPLSREEQLTGMHASIKAAFTLNHQDLDGLLEKSGRVQGEGDDKYDAALADLLEDYHQDISEDISSAYTGSSEVLLGVGKAADRRKTEAASDMAAYLNAGGGAAERQRNAAARYRQEFRNFIVNEDTELSRLEEAAEKAFSRPSFSIREHLMRLFEGQEELSADILGDDQFSMEIAQDLLASQKMLLAGDSSRRIKGMYDYRYDAYMDVRLHEFDMMRLESKERKAHWDGQMRAVLARGQMEWTDGEKRLKSRYEDWMENVSREYRNKKDAWGDKYLDFLTDKNTWLSVVTEQSARIGDSSVLEDFGEITQAAISSAGGDIIISTLAEAAPDADSILSQAVDLELLDKLLENASSLNQGIKAFKPAIFTSLDGDKFSTAELMQDIKDFQSIQNEEYKQHVSKREYGQMLDRLADAEERFNKQVQAANDGVADSLHKTMRSDGYILSGEVYRRDLVVGSSVADGILFDVGTVNAYSDFSDYTGDFTSEAAVPMNS